MAVECLLADPHHQPCIFWQRHGLRGKHGDLPGLALLRDVAVDRPALALLPLALQHARRRPAFLLVARLGPHELHRDHLRIAWRLDLRLDLCDHDIAVAAAAEAAVARQGRVGEHFDPQTSQRVGRHERLEFIRVPRRQLSLHEPRAVLAPAEARPAGTAQLQRLERLPCLLWRGEGGPNRLLPIGHERVDIRRLGLDGGFGVSHDLVQPCQFPLLLRRGQQVHGIDVAAATVLGTLVRASLRHVIKEGEERIKLLLRERIVLVVVAAGAAGR